MPSRRSTSRWYRTGHRADRRPEGLPHRHHDRRRRHGAVRGERPDDQAAPPPALRGVRLHGVHRPRRADAIAAVIPDRVLIQGGAATPTPMSSTGPTGWRPTCTHADSAAKTARSALAGHEVGQDLLGIYAYNGHEYVEALLGCVPRPRRAVQRQLPLRRERTAVPARRRRRLRAGLPRGLRATRRRGPAPPTAPAGADPDRRRIGQRPGPRRRRL